MLVYFLGCNIFVYVCIVVMGEFECQGYNNLVVGVFGMVVMMIDKYGSDELKCEVLFKIIVGEEICSFGYFEFGLGLDVFVVQCRVMLEGNGWCIDGIKMWISGVNFLMYVFMLVWINIEVVKYKGFMMFIVLFKIEGVIVQVVYIFMDEWINIIFYDGVCIFDSWCLGDVDGGVKMMSVVFEFEYGGGFFKVMNVMIEVVEEFCVDLKCGGKLLIEYFLVQVWLVCLLVYLWVFDMLIYCL